MKTLSPARILAFDILLRVERNGAWASELLLTHAKTLDPRDAALASELVFGCLRYQLQLDYLIGQLTAARKIDTEIRIALRLGLYQIRYLDRIPRHAAVSETAELARYARKQSATGFLNAILRKANRDPVEWPNRATALSCPDWLLARWDAQYGPEISGEIARAFLAHPESYVASTGRIQDIGSQSIVPLLDLAPGQSFLDICAAPGNKTAQALERGVQAIACDLYPHRLRALSGLACARVALDATQPLPFSAAFDRILVDAPCSGTGTLGRNPESKWRLRPSDLLQLQARQTAILRQALTLRKPHATLVYSTCSLEREENEDVIAGFPGPWRTVRRIPGRGPGDGFFAAVLTSTEVDNAL